MDCLMYTSFPYALLQDDTDVSGNILNVSFSARRPEAEVGVGGDTSVYYSPTHLRERVYLHRATLARLATVQVCYLALILIDGSR